MREFAAVRSVFGEEDKFDIFLLEDKTITVTVPLEDKDDLKEWKEYFATSSAWKEHMENISPLSSLHSGTYVNVDRYVLTLKTQKTYDDLLKILKKSGGSRTAIFPLASS